ncbi:MAG: peptidoglycan-associated lipoprotein, partial [Stenotrophomonas bentonitica]
MNKTTRVLLVSLLSVAALAGCSKKVKEAPVAPVDTGSTTAPTGPSTSGLYGPGDLDTDSCLRQRVVYFDLDKEDVKPEFQAIMACHAKYLR